MVSFIEEHREAILSELEAQQACRPEPKDILVVVHDQLAYVEECLNSLIQHTRDARILVWDNGSAPATVNYLRTMAVRGHILLTESWGNQGFIIPNNRLCAQGTSPYVILVNSDVRVEAGWSEALVGYLQAHPSVGVVGYQGSRLDHRGEGGQPALGRQIDYVCGWCLCLRRDILPGVGGLFDEDHLEFAYGEDSDLCLRVREAGHAIHALHLDLVTHYGHQTIQVVRTELGQAVSETFRRNHDYIRGRWASYLPPGDSDLLSQEAAVDYVGIPSQTEEIQDG